MHVLVLLESLSHATTFLLLPPSSPLSHQHPPLPPLSPSLPLSVSTYPRVEEHQVGFMGMKVLDPGRCRRGVEGVVANEEEGDLLLAGSLPGGVAEGQGGGVFAPVVDRGPAHGQEQGHALLFRDAVSDEEDVAGLEVLSQEAAHVGAVESLEGATRVVGHPRVLVVGQMQGLLLREGR